MSTNVVPFPNVSDLPVRPYGSASWETLASRYTYGGKKGRRAGALLAKAGFFHMIEDHMREVEAACRAKTSR